MSKIKEYLLWLPVVWMVNDAFASFALMDDFLAQGEKNEEQAVLADRKGKSVVLIDKISFKIGRKYQRGDLVSLRDPDYPRSTMFGRLVAQEGDWIRTKETKIERIPKGFSLIETVDSSTCTFSKRVLPKALFKGKAVYKCFPKVGAIPKQKRDQDILLSSNDHA